MKNPPHSSTYASRSQYLAEIITFYALKDVPLNKKDLQILGGEKRPIENRGYDTVEIWLLPFKPIMLPNWSHSIFRILDILCRTDVYSRSQRHSLVFYNICDILDNQAVIRNLKHTSSILELFVTNSMASKHIHFELQMHSLARCNALCLLIVDNLPILPYVIFLANVTMISFLDVKPNIWF